MFNLWEGVKHMKYQYCPLYADRTNIYLGKNAGERVKKTILNAKKSVKIISPFLSPEFIDLLKAKANQGVEVILITGDDRSSRFDQTGQGAVIRRLITQQRFVNETAKTEKDKKVRWLRVGMILSIVLIFACLLLMPSLKPKLSFSALCIIAAVIFSSKLKAAKQLPIFYYQYFSAFKFKVIKQNAMFGNFFHLKAYSVDGETAYLGSLNFTKSGFQHNIESCVTVTGATAQEIDTYINDVYWSCEMSSYSEQEIVQTYFYEPPY